MTGLSDRPAEDFARAAEMRLRLAVDLYEEDADLLFGDRYIEMANVAMLVWSAGIDLISVHMLLSGETSLGTSASRRRYLVNRIVSANEPMGLQVGWRGLSRLHSYQHNLHLSEAEFASHCSSSSLLFAGLSSLLPTPLRLPPDAYGWLAEAG